MDINYAKIDDTTSGKAIKRVLERIRLQSCTFCDGEGHADKRCQTKRDAMRTMRSLGLENTWRDLLKAEPAGLEVEHSDANSESVDSVESIIEAQVPAIEEMVNQVTLTPPKPEPESPKVPTEDKAPEDLPKAIPAGHTGLTDSVKRNMGELTLDSKPLIQGLAPRLKEFRTSTRRKGIKDAIESSRKSEKKPDVNEQP